METREKIEKIKSEFLRRYENHTFACVGGVICHSIDVTSEYFKETGSINSDVTTDDIWNYFEPYINPSPSSELVEKVKEKLRYRKELWEAEFEKQQDKGYTYLDTNRSSEDVYYGYCEAIDEVFLVIHDILQTK